MKVERDFWHDGRERTDVYEWRVTVGGEQLVSQQRVNRLNQFGSRPVTIDELEHRAQRELMRCIQKKLFGDRCL